MKKVTIILEDADVAVIPGELIAKAASFNIESVGEERKKRRKTTINRIPNMTIEQAIMKHFTPKGHFASKSAEKWIIDAGYQATSWSPAISALRKLGYVERISSGMWGFVKPYNSGRQSFSAVQ